MELSELIEKLSQPAAYTHPCPGGVTVRQTHISAVFLAGEFAYKLKKPVNLGFVDFSTLEKREHFCHEEVRLNRRLAPDVYLGVLPITTESGHLRVNGTGTPLDWLVQMRRLPEEATLANRVQEQTVSSEEIERIAALVADFHKNAASSEAISAGGRFEVVAENARDNLRASTAQIGTTISAKVFQTLEMLLEDSLQCWQALITARAARHVPRDTHGDLRLDHVYLFPEKPPPHDVQIIDCVEFSERFRHADPVADMAFLLMDLHAAGRADLAQTLAKTYFARTGDTEGEALLSFYTAYRACIRGKVEGIKSRESEVPASSRENAAKTARRDWLVALSQLAEPRERPALVLVAGLPGTGKSTLARALAEAANFRIIRSDVVRKGLATREHETNLYTPAMTEATYRECRRQAEVMLFEGARVIVDATFRDETQRVSFFSLPRELGVRGVGFVCQASEEVVRARLAARSGDASDADWTIYEKLASEWEKASDFIAVDTHDGEAAHAFALGELKRLKLI